MLFWVPVKVPGAHHHLTVQRVPGSGWKGGALTIGGCPCIIQKAMTVALSTWVTCLESATLPARKISLLQSKFGFHYPALHTFAVAINSR